MALFTGDYLKDTRHLTPQKHGIYLLLLIHCWDTRGPVPLDEQECAGICNCRSADEIDSLRYVLKRYFTRMDDGWYNERMVKEIEKAEALSQVWSEAGKRGAEARIKLAQAKAKPRPKVGQALDTTSSSPSSLPSVLKSEALAVNPSGIPAVINLPLNDNTEYPITEKLINEWKALYSDCDVMQTLKEIRGWNIANPSKRKTKSGILNHVNRWLAKEHNRG